MRFSFAGGDLFMSRNSTFYAFDRKYESVNLLLQF